MVIFPPLLRAASSEARAEPIARSVKCPGKARVGTRRSSPSTSPPRTKPAFRFAAPGGPRPRRHGDDGPAAAVMSERRSGYFRLAGHSGGHASTPRSRRRKNSPESGFIAREEAFGRGTRELFLAGASLRKKGRIPFRLIATSPVITSRLPSAFRESNRELVCRKANEFRELGRSQSVEISSQGATNRLPSTISGEERGGHQAFGRSRPLDPPGEPFNQELDRSPVILDVAKVQIRQRLDRPGRVGSDDESLLSPREKNSQLERHVHPGRVRKIREAVLAGQHELDDLSYADFQLGSLLRHAGIEAVSRGRREDGHPRDSSTARRTGCSGRFDSAGNRDEPARPSERKRRKGGRSGASSG